MPIFAAQNEPTIKNNVDIQIGEYDKQIASKENELKIVSKTINAEGLYGTEYDELLGLLGKYGKGEIVSKAINGEELNDAENKELEELFTKITDDINNDLDRLTIQRDYLEEIFRAETNRAELEKSKHEYETNHAQNNKNIAEMKQKNAEMEQLIQVNTDQIYFQTQQNIEYNAMIDSINMALERLTPQSGGYRKKYLKYKQKYLLLKKK
jgi:hypothetical protein